jgi:CheY-like chemotaxis protein
MHTSLNSSFPALFRPQDQPPPPGFAASLSHSRSVQDGSSRIFVIDDDTLIADSLAKILNAYGYQAMAHYSGAAALDSARAQCPDIVLSDVIMPRSNGIETALAILALCPKVRVVLFSGQAGTADLLKETRAQGHHFELLPKPIHPEELLKKLASLSRKT